MKAVKIKSLLAGVIISVTHTNSMPAGFTMWGESDCGRWVSESQTNPTLKAWLLGYLSGLGVIYSDIYGDDLMGKIKSSTQIYLWIDNYCQKNPLSNVGGAGAMLFKELKSK